MQSKAVRRPPGPVPPRNTAAEFGFANRGFNGCPEGDYFDFPNTMQVSCLEDDEFIKQIVRFSQNLVHRQSSIEFQYMELFLQ